MHTETSPREIRFPSNVFGAMRAALAHQDSQPSTLVSALRTLGFALGEPLSREVEARIAGLADTPIREVATDSYWNALTEAFDDLGWGTLRFEEAHPGVGALASDDWAEADGRDGLSRPACHLTTGLLSDLLGRVSDSDVAVLEVECRGSGDTRCRFLFGAPDTMDGVFRRLREGDSVEDALEALS